jgi:hypothetical protein
MITLQEQLECARQLAREIEVVGWGRIYRERQAAVVTTLEELVAKEKVRDRIRGMMTMEKPNSDIE